MQDSASTPAATPAPVSVVASGASNNTLQAHPCYAVRTQSGRLHDDETFISVPQMDRRLAIDLQGRTTEVGDGLAADLFPDEAFGFPINDPFVKNFCGSFISTSKLFDASNFHNEEETATFLNRMITTIASFLHSTGKTSLVPLRYFTNRHATTPLDGPPAKVKPDIIVAPLIDGCIRQGALYWKDVKSIIEHTRELTPPSRMAQTVSVKSYMTFCHQPERDFVPFLCITGTGIHIVITDHVGHIETDVIPFSRTATTLIFIRMVMGLTFLPDSNLGLDKTITRVDDGLSGGRRLTDIFPPFKLRDDIPKPNIQLFLPDPSISINPPTNTPTITSNDGNGIVSISIGSTTYEVIRLIFRAQTLIGRATRAFLVKLPDGRIGVLKDSWITTNRKTEASFIQGLDIPYGPQLVNHCILRNTGAFRDNPIKMSLIQECREKRRIVTYPAGVHISDFSSLWELMVAMLDVVVAILYLESQYKLHRDISYTNILLRESGVDSYTNGTRKKLIERLGLSDIEKLRKELNCREGLLIDFDYGSLMSDTTTQLEQESEDYERGKEVADDVDQASQSVGEETQESHVASAPANGHKPNEPSGARTGTAPFIAIELLIYGSSHRVAHDLESVLYVLLFICTHLQGPFGKVRDPPLYGGDENCNHPSLMKQWMQASQLSVLGYLKFSHMISHFEDCILPSMSPYFFPLICHLRALWNALIPERETTASNGKQVVHSTATAQTIINVFKNALQDKDLIKAHTSVPSVLGKRSAPGDLVVGTNGWDAAKVPRNIRKTEPKLSPKITRQAKFMAKASAKR